MAHDVPGLRFVSKLRPVTFRWDLHKLDAFDGVSHAASDPVAEAARAAKQERHYTGFLAQEVESAAQQCGHDFSGVIKPANERSHYELSYTEFVVPLVNAVQEQQQQIEALRATVQKLEAARQARSRGPVRRTLDGRARRARCVGLATRQAAAIFLMVAERVAHVAAFGVTDDCRVEACG